MPVILPEEHHDAWLSGEAGKEILVPFPADRMNAWPISARVNSPKNNDAEIIVPIKHRLSGLEVNTKEAAKRVSGRFMWISSISILSVLTELN
jgi:hypothetical protein